ncbi:hypothetical protein [Psychromonas sp. MME1]|uniref:hypothetical protein n=1 Tax=Psychromonas sp. MME1 TaxID=3231032 RepID=UPI0034E24235
MKYLSILFLLLVSSKVFSGSCLGISNFEEVISSNNTLIHVKVIRTGSPFEVDFEVLTVYKGSDLPKVITAKSVPMQLTVISPSNMKMSSEYIVALTAWESGFQLPICGNNAALVKNNNLYLRDMSVGIS